ncbi:MAG: type IV pilus modification PilV family protein [Bryobacteraceae bacterium]
MKRRGFSLLELLVATTIMGVAVVGLISTLSGSVRSAQRIVEYDRAVLIARSKMDALLLDPTLPKVALLDGPFDAELLGGAMGGWRARVAPFEVPAKVPPGTPILERIDLEIWWMSGEQRRTVRLEGFRRGVLAP